MSIHKVPGGFQAGAKGKVHPTRAAANAEQAQGMIGQYANGGMIGPMQGHFAAIPNVPRFLRPKRPPRV